MTIPERLSGFFDALEYLEIRYLVGGSFASGRWGIPRFTQDIDVSIIIDRDDAELLIEHLQSGYEFSPADIREALDSTEQYRGFQLLYLDQIFKIDVFVPERTEYNLLSQSRGRLYDLWPGRPVVFQSPEDTIISKLRWFELGNHVSDKQWNDIIGVLEVQGENLDLPYLTQWTIHFGVYELLVKAQSQVV